MNSNPRKEFERLLRLRQENPQDVSFGHKQLWKIFNELTDKKQEDLDRLREMDRKMGLI